jgi:hypothetical protein
MIYAMIGCLILFGIISIDMITNSRDTFERNVGSCRDYIDDYFSDYYGNNYNTNLIKNFDYIY